MRLDLFLKATRLCPRRTVGQRLCDAGLVSINGLPAKSAHSVKPGDEITIKRRDRRIKVRVEQVPETKQVSKQPAGDLVTVISDEKVEST